MMRMKAPVAFRMPVLTAAPLPFVVRMMDDARAGRSGALRRLILRSIVDDENFAPVRGRAKPADERANRGRFVERRER